MNEIIEKNFKIVTEFFTGIASGNYYDGSCYRLYLDLEDNSMRISQEVSENTWQQRDDNSLICLETVSGYSDIPEEELYHEGDSLYDFEFQYWLDGLEDTILNKTGILTPTCEIFHRSGSPACAIFHNVHQKT